MNAIRPSVLFAFGAIVMAASTADAGIDEVKEAVKCANRCVAALSGASGCEQGIAACEKTLVKQMVKASEKVVFDAELEEFIKSAESRPKWIDQTPSSNKYLFGSGEGSDMNEAFAKAAAVIAAQIKVDVDASFEMTTTLRDSRSEQNGRVSTSNELRQDVKDKVSTSTGGIISGIVVTGTYTDVKGRVFVLASLNLDEFKANKARATEQMGLAIFEAARDVVNSIESANAIGPANVTGWNGHLEYLKDRIREDDENVWKKEFMDFQAGIASLTACIEPVSTGNGAARLITEGKNRVGFACKGRPWVQSRFQMTAVGGLVDMPGNVETDDMGVVSVPIGSAYGKDMAVQVEPDGLDKLKALKVMLKKSGKPARLPLTGRVVNGATRVLLKGAPDKGSDGLKESLKSIATRFWSGTVAGDRAVLELRAEITFGQPVSLGDKVNVPCNIALAVREVGSDTLLWEKRLNTAAMGETVEKAQAAAVNNMTSVIRNLK